MNGEDRGPATTLTEFLLARIAEDEQVAGRNVIPAHDGYKPHGVLDRWRYVEHDEVEYNYPYDDDRVLVTCDSEGLSPAVDENAGPHIARWDPRRVLAECEAKRRIVAEHPSYEHVEMNRGICLVVRLLALPYRDHPDFCEEWLPGDLRSVVADLRPA